MKNLAIVMALVMLIGAGVVVAQDSQQPELKSQKIQKRPMKQFLQIQSSTEKSVDQTQAGSEVSSNVTLASAAEEKKAVCDGTGRGFGDGSKLKPRDGTGFGAKSGNRRHRNAKLGQGQQKGAQNGNPQRLRRRLKDGSCASEQKSSENSK